jgi:DNA-binding protein Alba
MCFNWFNLVICEVTTSNSSLILNKLNGGNMAERADSNIVFIGDKSVRTYSESCDVQFEDKQSKEVIIRSRGKFIVNAVNVAQFVVRRSEGKIEITSVKIGSEKFKAKDMDKEIYVSNIDITLTKK